MIITKRNGTYLIKNNEYYDVYVDDVLVERGKVRQSSQAPGKIYKKETRSRSIGWFDNDVELIIANEEYKAMESALEWPDEDGDFSSLDNEFVWRKFHERYSHRSENYEHLEPVEFTILEITESEYDDIVSYYSLGTALEKNVAEFLYTPDIESYMIEIAEKYNLTVVKEDRTYNVKQRGKNQLVLSNHNVSWEFAKVNGNYIDSSSSAQNKRWKQSWRGDYATLTAKRAKIYAEVELAIKRQLPQKASLSQSQVQDALKMVSDLKYSANKIQSFQKTTRSLGSVRIGLKELEDYLNSILEQA